MRALRPSELVTILRELQRQITVEQYNEQRNHWAFLAAVKTNGFSALSGAFGGKRRKPKTVEPDDFFDKKAKKILQRLLGQGQDAQKTVPEHEPKNWSRHVEDARTKGLAGPW